MTLDMPTIKGFDYLVGYLSDLGFITNDGGSISYSEIKAWSDLMYLQLSPFESSLLRKMSNAYSVMAFKARENIPAPFMSDNDIEKQNQKAFESFKQLASK